MGCPEDCWTKLYSNLVQYTPPKFRISLLHSNITSIILYNNSGWRRPAIPQFVVSHNSQLWRQHTRLQLILHRLISCTYHCLDIYFIHSQGVHIYHLVPWTLAQGPTSLMVPLYSPVIPQFVWVPHSGLPSLVARGSILWPSNCYSDWADPHSSPGALTLGPHFIYIICKVTLQGLVLPNHPGVFTATPNCCKTYHSLTRWVNVWSPGILPWSLTIYANVS